MFNTFLPANRAVSEITVYLLVNSAIRKIYPFTAEAQTALFKDPVRTAL
jgi:hypothetical protein